MGEIADMMLEGALCEGCGEYLGEGDGYRRMCAACEADVDAQPINQIKDPPEPEEILLPHFQCPDCNRRPFTSIQAYRDHWGAKHG